MDADAGMDPLIVNLAPTGMVPTRADSLHVPLTPDEIARDVAAGVAAGASIVHLHARDEDGRPTWRSDVYADIMRRVRRACPDVIACVSTSGRTFGAFEQRSAVLDLGDDLRPDMASLTLGSMNFPKQASVNEPQMIARLAARMAERGIVPELEVFDLGMLDYARYLIGRGALKPPFYVNILLGSLGTLGATPLNLALMVQALPSDATWAAAGIGRFQFPMNALAIVTGGHVRVGLEDNLFLDTAKTTPATNAGLVARLVDLARAAGRTVARPGDARGIIGLAARSPVGVG